MADITYTKRATERRAQNGVVAGKGDANTLKNLLTATIEMGGTEAVNSTIFFGRIQSNARLSQRSRVYWDDLATSGAPTLDIGLASVDSNVTSDPDALNNGLTLATADAEGVPLLADHANAGKYAWQFINGQTTDPGGLLDVYGTIVDTTIDTSGTITVEVFGYLD